ncbi:MAG TPA: HlyD family efflux transporter periplasmic adaptor subunit [Ramlibacter sp.]|jgi:multidrug efflux pump subunit AcrA (membrane-fusion protein)|uniref:efflux RND transporter periplasmic adaptor subunit n=1 Tax=Ramlibacter sp. TaxID=1917967 RepID=UPI002D3E1EEB|nr:HlyD family efflux transporter periplasmic adaptor subunit [Ramlibacter sp.]HZY19742.1 HlyD family efflux transporter periplasmic adaptor subunit [Ramlibacter sp.]
MVFQDPAQDLLQYEAELVAATSAAEAAFVAVNRLGVILPFRLAVLLQPDPVRHARVAAVSHLYEVDENAPFAQWLARITRHAGEQPVATLTAATLPPDLAQDWGEWLPEHAVLCRLATPAGVLIGWLLVGFEQAPGEGGGAVLQLAARQVALVLGAWQGRRWISLAQLRRVFTRKVQIGAVLALLLLAVVPVRLAALGPAEVTPLVPASITAPTEGVLARFHVAPNALVKAGDLIASMDDTVLRNRHAVALKGLEVARAELARAGSKAFGDDQSRADLLTLKARVDERQAEVASVEELLQRIQLRAPSAGLVIYSSPDEWIGRSLATGERIATVADPARAALTVHLAAEDVIAVSPGADVRFFQNVAPLSALDARLTVVGYEAEPTVDASLAYVLRAEFAGGTELPRLGLRGTAKVYGGYVPLGYYLLRRPLASLRRLLGV